MRARLVWVPGSLSFRKWAVVYYLHGQTGRSTVWEKGNQNLGLVNVVTESRLPFVQISYICRKTATKAWTGIKDGFEEREHEFRPEKQDYLFRDSVIPGNSPLERPRKSCSIYFPTRFSGMANNPCLRPPPTPKKSSHNHCFQFLLGSTVYPRGKENNSYAKVWGVGKVYYGLYENGELLWQKSDMNAYKNGAKF